MFNQNDEDNLIFLAEVEELLLIMEDGLLKLEREGFDELSLNEVFRAAHTIKGGAALLDIAPLADATHLLEDLLDAVRCKRVPLDEQVLDTLLESLDWLSQAKGQLQAGRFPETDETLITHLRHLLGSEEDMSRPQDRPSGNRLEADPKQRCTLILKFAEDAALLSIRAFQALTLAKEHWQVVGSEPTEEDLEQDLCGPSLRLHLDEDPDKTDFSSIIQKMPEVISFDIELPKINEREKVSTEDLQYQSRTIRISVDLLDELLALAGELVVDRARLSDVLSKLQDQKTEVVGDQLREIANHMGRITSQLQEGVMRGRLVPLSNIFRKLPRLVRDLSKAANKKVDLVISGEGTELDRSVMEYIDDPLIHILRNAIDHGLEDPDERTAAGKPPGGQVKLSAEHAQSQIIITIEDDGRGVDLDELKQRAISAGAITEEAASRMSRRQNLDLIFFPGLSTAKEVTEVSGRGVGLDVVQTNLRRISGRIEVDSQPDRGTRFQLYLPLTLAIIHGLLVSSQDRVYAFPVASVIEAVPVKEEDVHTVTDRQVLSIRDQIFPLVSLDVLLGEAAPSSRLTRYALLVQVQTGSVALGVDSIVGEQEIVIKELGSYIGQVPGVTGATILGDGSLALIIDPSTLMQASGGSDAS